MIRRFRRSMGVRQGWNSIAITERARCVVLIVGQARGDKAE